MDCGIELKLMIFNFDNYYAKDVELIRKKIMMIDLKNHITLKFSIGHHVNVLKTKEIKCFVTFF